MSIFDRVKKQGGKETKSAAKQETVVEVVKEPRKSARIVKKEFTNAYRILQKPLVTEKSVNLSTLQNQYVFKVSPSANKNEVKKVIQDLYGVKVNRVNILNTKGKKRRMGKHEGFKPGFKKAVVFLAPNEKIEVISR